MNINSWRPGLSASGASAIVGVRAYGFIDLEGAKVSAIIVEYGREILARSVDAGTFAISDYTIRQILLNGRESAIERAGETAAGNEGGVVKVYVSDRPEPSQGGGAERGRYVIVEVETDYTLSGQNIDYRAAMAVGVVQQKAIESTEGTIPPCRVEAVNYEIVERQDRRGKKTAVPLARMKNGIRLFPLGNRRKGARGCWRAARRTRLAAASRGFPSQAARTWRPGNTDTAFVNPSAGSTPGGATRKAGAESSGN